MYISTSTKYHAKSTLGTSTITSKQKYLVAYKYKYIKMYLSQ